MTKKQKFLAFGLIALLSTILYLGFFGCFLDYLYAPKYSVNNIQTILDSSRLSSKLYSIGFFVGVMSILLFFTTMLYRKFYSYTKYAKALLISWSIFFFTFLLAYFPVRPFTTRGWWDETFADSFGGWQFFFFLLIVLYLLISAPLWFLFYKEKISKSKKGKLLKFIANKKHRLGLSLGCFLLLIGYVLLIVFKVHAAVLFLITLPIIVCTLFAIINHKIPKLILILGYIGLLFLYLSESAGFTGVFLQGMIGVGLYMIFHHIALVIIFVLWHLFILKMAKRLGK